MFTKKHLKTYLLAGLAIVTLTGCSQKVSLSEPWDAEKCNKNLENALEQINQYWERVVDKRAELEELERIGGYEKAANQLRTDISNLKQGQLAGNLNYIDQEVFERCDKGTLDSALLARVDTARSNINSEEASFAAEDLPDLRVTKVMAEFVPLEIYEENDSCAGPFMDLTFTVANLGVDFPRAVDWEKYNNHYEKGQVSTQPELAPFISLSSELDFGGRKESAGTTASRIEFSDGIFNRNETYTYETRVPVYDNETSLTVAARVKGGHAFFETAAHGWDNSFEETFEIPIWDIFPSAAVTKRETNSEGDQTVQTSLYVGNNGKSATPGPIYGSFTVHNKEDEPSIFGGTGNTGLSAPRDFAGVPFEKDPETGEARSIGLDTVAILGEEKTPRIPLEKDLIVKASVLLLCPNGSTGSLHDGDTSNNNRVLKTN